LEGGDNKRVMGAVVFAGLHFSWKCNAIGKLTFVSGRNGGHCEDAQMFRSLGEH
jgi:hypothetical protein